MTSIVESFTTYLEANSTITALLASAESIYPGGAPQQNDGYPLLTYELSSDDQFFNLEGTVNELAIAALRLSVWDKNIKTINDIATTIKSELNGFRGAFGSHTADLITKENEFSTPEEADTGLNRIVLEFRIAYY